jgi:hypothetical protein
VGTVRTRRLQGARLQESGLGQERAGDEASAAPWSSSIRRMVEIALLRALKVSTTPGVTSMSRYLRQGGAGRVRA